MRSLFPFFLFLIVLTATGASAQSVPAPDTAKTLSATLVGVQAGPSFALRFFGADAATVVKPANGAVLAMLGRATPGDTLTLNVDDPAAPRFVTAVLTVQSPRG